MAKPGDNIAQEEKVETLAELGAKLKSLREAQGLSIAELSKETKLQKQYLEAMENGRLDVLPKGPYVRSFLKQYCARLGAPDLWEKFDIITKDRKLVVPGMLEQHKSEEQSYAANPRTFKKRSYIWIYAIVIISLAAAGWITWQYRSEFKSVSTSPIDGGTTSVENPAPPQPEQNAAAPQNAATAPTNAPGDAVDLGWMDSKPLKETPTATTAAPQSQDAAATMAKGYLKLTANSVVWLKVSEDGKVLFEGIIKQGESKEYTVGESPLRVRYGNPGKTSVFWNGEETTPVADGGKPTTRYYRPDGTVTTKR